MTYEEALKAMGVDGMRIRSQSMPAQEWYTMCVHDNGELVEQTPDPDYMELTDWEVVKSGE